MGARHSHRTLSFLLVTDSELLFSDAKTFASALGRSRFTRGQSDSVVMDPSRGPSLLSYDFL